MKITSKQEIVTAQLAGALRYTVSLQRGKVPHPPNKCPATKPSEAPVLELWGIWSTPSLPLLPGQFWPRMVVPVKVPSIDQIKLLTI